MILLHVHCCILFTNSIASSSFAFPFISLLATNRNQLQSFHHFFVIAFYFPEPKSPIFGFTPVPNFLPAAHCRSMSSSTAYSNQDTSSEELLSTRATAIVTRDRLLAIDDTSLPAKLRRLLRSRERDRLHQSILTAENHNRTITGEVITSGIDIILVTPVPSQPVEGEEHDRIVALTHFGEEVLGFGDNPPSTNVLPWGAEMIRQVSFRLYTDFRFNRVFPQHPGIHTLDRLGPQEAIRLLEPDERYFLEWCRYYNISIPESERKRILTVNIIRSRPYMRHLGNIITILRNREVFGASKFNPLTPNYHRGDTRKIW